MAEAVVWQVAVSVLLGAVSKNAPGSAGTATGRAGCPGQPDEDRLESGRHGLRPDAPGGSMVGWAVADQDPQATDWPPPSSARAMIGVSGMDASGAPCRRFLPHPRVAKCMIREEEGCAERFCSL